MQPLAEVVEAVRARVVAQQAAALARKAGEARLAELRTSGDASSLSVAVLLSRSNLQNQPRAVVDAVLRADAAKLPQWIGVDLADAGYAVVRLASVKPIAADAPELAQLLPRYAQAWAAAEAQAYYKALEGRFKVELKLPAAASSASAATS